MNGNEGRDQARVSSIIGWLILAAGIIQIPAIIGMVLIERIVPTTGLTLLLIQILIGAFLLFAGGVGLLLGKFFGYYCVYFVTFFGGIGGFKNPYIPFLKRWVNIGPATEDLFLVLNLAVVAILIWEHWQRTVRLGPERQHAHRLAIISLAVVGLAWIAAGQVLVHRESGQKSVASSLPVVGTSFVDFTTAGKLDYISVQTKFPSGITIVFSGNGNDGAVEKLAAIHQLKKMDDVQAHKKFLPQAKAWNLDEKVFPTRFSDSDSYYVGRLKEMGKVTLQIVYRRSDGRFTAQVFGIP